MMLVDYKRRMQAKSAALLLSIETRLDRLMMGWLLVAGFASALRIATSPFNGSLGAAGLFPYLLLIVAPFASMVLALRWFADADNCRSRNCGWPAWGAGVRFAYGSAWATALWRERADGLVAGRDADQRAGARGRISRGDAGGQRPRARLAIDAAHGDDPGCRPAVEPLYHRIRRGSAPGATVSLPAGRHLDGGSGDAAQHRQGHRRCRRHCLSTSRLRFRACSRAMSKRC